MNKIFIGTPCYGGMITADYFKSCMQLVALAASKKIELQFGTIGNESLITRARNTIVSMFLDDKDYVGSHLLFIDADVGFGPANIDRLIRADKDIVCGIYPRKCIHWDQVIRAVKENPNITEEQVSYKALGYNLNFEDVSNIKLQGGYTEVMEAATGMMLIKRDVFKKLQEAYPDRKYKSDQIVNGNRWKSDNCYDFFGVGKLPWDKEERYLSEDYYFSRLWSNIQGKIWADVASPLVHHGNMHFKGHVGTIFSVADDTNKTKTSTRNKQTDK